MMAQAASAALAVAATTVAADTVVCTMANDTPLTFTIDPNQFAPPVDTNEPPRQTRTIVRFGDKQFPATPFILGTTRGFEAEGLGGTTTLFVMQQDGSAVFSDRRAGTRITGSCIRQRPAQ